MNIDSSLQTMNLGGIVGLDQARSADGIDAAGAAGPVDASAWFLGTGSGVQAGACIRLPTAEGTGADVATLAQRVLTHLVAGA